MEKIKTCCVTGHRDIPAEWADIIQKYLRMEIIAAVEDGYTHFISVVKFHSTSYSKDCYMRRNRYMVDQSQRIIAVYDGRSTGGTAATVRYAKGKDVRVVWR